MLHGRVAHRRRRGEVHGRPAFAELLEVPAARRSANAPSGRLKPGRAATSEAPGQGVVVHRRYRTAVYARRTHGIARGPHDAACLARAGAACVRCPRDVAPPRPARGGLARGVHVPRAAPVGPAGRRDRRAAADAADPRLERRARRLRCVERGRSRRAAHARASAALGCAATVTRRAGDPKKITPRPHVRPVERHDQAERARRRRRRARPLVRGAHRGEARRSLYRVIAVGDAAVGVLRATVRTSEAAPSPTSAARRFGLSFSPTGRSAPSRTTAGRSKCGQRRAPVASPGRSGRSRPSREPS